jgi:hypothetical protein
MQQPKQRCTHMALQQGAHMQTPAVGHNSVLTCTVCFVAMAFDASWMRSAAWRPIMCTPRISPVSLRYSILAIPSPSFSASACTHTTSSPSHSQWQHTPRSSHKRTQVTGNCAGQAVCLQKQFELLAAVQQHPYECSKLNKAATAPAHAWTCLKLAHCRSCIPSSWP